MTLVTFVIMLGGAYHLLPLQAKRSAVEVVSKRVHPTCFFNSSNFVSFKQRSFLLRRLKQCDLHPVGILQADVEIAPRRHHGRMNQRRAVRQQSLQRGL